MDRNAVNGGSEEDVCFKHFQRLWRLDMAFLMDRIAKKGEPTALEQQVATALNEVAAGSEESVQKAMRLLKIAGVKEAESDGVKVAIVSVPYTQISAYRQISGYLVGEVEKKLPGYQVVIVGKRIHYDLKGGQTTHVFLDPNDETRVADRLAGFAVAYHRLTGLRTVFEVAKH